MRGKENGEVHTNTAIVSGYNDNKGHGIMEFHVFDVYGKNYRGKERKDATHERKPSVEQHIW